MSKLDKLSDKSLEDLGLKLRRNPLKLKNGPKLKGKLYKSWVVWGK